MSLQFLFNLEAYDTKHHYLRHSRLYLRPSAQRIGSLWDRLLALACGKTQGPTVQAVVSLFAPAPSTRLFLFCRAVVGGLFVFALVVSCRVQFVVCADA